MIIFRGTIARDYIRHDLFDDVFEEAWIASGDGDDSIVGAAESRTIMEGGRGNDYYSIKNFNDRVIEEADGGIETVQYNTEVLDAVPGLTVVMEGSPLDYLAKGGFPFGFHLMDRDVEVIREAHWRDDQTQGLNFIGNDETNVFMGDHDNIRLNRAFGMGGDDHLFLGPGDDEGYGGDGNDHLEGGSGDDRLDGEAGRDKVFGGEGADSITFGSDDGDIADGGLGDDRFYFLGAGESQAIGGAGRDEFVFEGLGSSLEILDFSPDVDRIDLARIGIRGEDLEFVANSDGFIEQIDFVGRGTDADIRFGASFDFSELTIGSDIDDANLVVIA